MPRRKTIEYVEQTIHLSDDVTVTARWPKGFKPVIQWNGDVVTIALKGVQMSQMSIDSLIVDQPRDTPELLAMKARLPADPTSGGLRRASRETVPMTSEDAFRQVGLDLDPGELSGEGLEILADNFKAAVGG